MLTITLAAARVNAKMTQAEAAKYAGVTQKTISSWESGKSAPDALSFRRLCEVYGVQMTDIFLSKKST